jgi:hypothetical protein
MELGIPARPVGDGSSQPQGRLQDQEDLQEAGEKEGLWLLTLYYGVREALRMWLGSWSSWATAWNSLETLGASH